MCKRFFVDESIQGQCVNITGEENNHLVNVLRMKVGDKIIVNCGDEYDYICTITEMEKRLTRCTINDKVINAFNPTKQIDVFQSLIKNDKMAIVTQKLNEIGVSNLKLFETKFQTVKPSENKQDKLQKISNQSAKQCKRSIPMQVSSILTFNEMLVQLNEYDIILFANECEKTVVLQEVLDKLQSVSSVAIIIGSEGGFSAEEIDAIMNNSRVESVSLGSRILRAETASIVLSGFVSLYMNN